MQMKTRKEGHEATSERIASSNYTMAKFCMTLIRGLNGKGN